MQPTLAGKKTFKRIYNSFIALGLVSLFAIKYGLDNLDNYHSWFSFISLALITGLVAGIILTKIIYKFCPSIVGMRGPSYTPLMFIVCINTMLLFTGLARFINESNVHETICSNYPILETGHSSGNQNHAPVYYLFINYNGKKERLAFPEKYALQFKAGDSTQICLKKGNLGFSFFEPDYKNW